HDCHRRHDDLIVAVHRFVEQSRPHDRAEKPGTRGETARCDPPEHLRQIPRAEFHAVDCSIPRGRATGVDSNAMRVALVTLLGGCSFASPFVGGGDGGTGMETTDAPAKRARSQLIGIWTFDEGTGTRVHDTSNASGAVDLDATGPVVWNGDGTMSISSAS